VEAGTILAQIDNTVYTADVTLAQAQLEQAQAGVLRAQADLAQMQAKLDQALRDWERAQNLGPSDALAQASYDRIQIHVRTGQGECRDHAGSGHAVQSIG